MKKKEALHDEVARVAHELSEKRAPKRDLEDQLEAEKIVTEKHERHARETEQQVEVAAKTRQGFRRHP